jgi:hypothetical protein
MKWNVEAVAMDRNTRQRIAGPRIELIDSENNSLFKECETAMDVELRYECFWNDLNSESKEIVKVIGIDCII